MTLEWLPIDTWIVVVGALCAMSCALLGTFLVLRKMSMMGDALSHAVLPGLAVAFILTGSRSSLTMLAGAAAVGVLAAILTEWVQRIGKVEKGASMGVVFTILFALGLILIRYSADHVDLDPDCVLYGAIELVPLDTIRLGGTDLPRAAMTTGGVLLLNTLFVITLYKELKITAFDPGLATTVGINARWVHYLLMSLVAITTVAAFESVGSILVIAMLIVPPATAHLLTDRLGRLLLLSVLLAAAAAAVGHVAALVVPGWLGYSGVSTSTAGMMAWVAGLFFLAAMLLAPRHGVIGRALHRAAMELRVVREDLLGVLYRAQEAGRHSLDAPALWSAQGRAWAKYWALGSLRRSGLVVLDSGNYRLTTAGRSAARELVRSHRLWETYLDRHAQVPEDHLHHPAERLEHVTDTGLRDRLAESLGHPPRDPHGSSIPPASEAPGGRSAN